MWFTSGIIIVQYLLINTNVGIKIGVWIDASWPFWACFSWAFCTSVLVLDPFLFFLLTLDRLSLGEKREEKNGDVAPVPEHSWSSPLWRTLILTIYCELLVVYFFPFSSWHGKQERQVVDHTKKINQFILSTTVVQQGMAKKTHTAYLYKAVTEN